MAAARAAAAAGGTVMVRQVAIAHAGVRSRIISHTAEYALRVVLYLATRPAHGSTSAAEAAAHVDVPERYLGRVLNALAHAGVLVSTRGARGGFRLAQPPAALTLAQVVGPFDAVGEPPQCLLRAQQCAHDDPCMAHARWQDAAAGVRTFFQATTVADLIAADVASDGGNASAERSGRVNDESEFTKMRNK